ncbi:hypothetical protein [Actinoplanes awajinensis]|uniref:Holin n=1 Tax=Actinoplanes awajinensis subsp. mycoplanecinus TaxID=135947 RepID=A0A124G8C9_9ACTN|nr:hypothetical protein [Actinoplanes awajinensis]KUL25587.1 hypothetical protein ADL15_40290 [Actinoplanes awajinensis subsp. mycoplanecinus]
MNKSKIFSGPPANKVAASTLAIAISTLFWTVAAHTFWKSLSAEDLATFVTASTVIVTAVVGYLVPESQEFAKHTVARAAIPPAPAPSEVARIEARLTDLEQGTRALGEDVTRLAVHGTKAPQ